MSGGRISVLYSLQNIMYLRTKQYLININISSSTYKLSNIHVYILNILRLYDVYAHINKKISKPKDKSQKVSGYIAFSSLSGLIFYHQNIDYTRLYSFVI
jgi:hypothetical protein